MAAKVKCKLHKKQPDLYLHQKNITAKSQIVAKQGTFKHIVENSGID
jgi:hypothetical protein